MTLARTDEVEFLLHEWPWSRTQDRGEIEKESLDVREAAKFGLRALSKGRWDQLKEEYLTYRRKLLDEMTAFEDTDASDPTSKQVTPAVSKPPPAQNSTPRPALEVPTMDMSSPYPLNCLVSVRNIHPETNKTTLRALFNTAFNTPTAKAQVQNGGLDYVDFNKGMDSVRPHLGFLTWWLLLTGA